MKYSLVRFAEVKRYLLKRLSLNRSYETEAEAKQRWNSRIKMNENDLKHILARNPAIRVEDNPRVPPPKQEPGTPDALAGVAEGEAKSLGRPTVSFTFYRQRLCDRDGLNPKDLLDGLVKAGLIADDSEACINLLHSDQVKVAHRSEQKTVITIRYE